MNQNQKMRDQNQKINQNSTRARSAWSGPYYIATSSANYLSDCSTTRTPLSHDKLCTDFAYKNVKRTSWEDVE